jgi:hypothetical protein
MKNKLLHFAVCIMVSMTACSSKTITYSVDGERPQEKYSVKLEPRNNPFVQLHFYRGEAVKGFKHRSSSRPMIAEEFLIAIMYTNGIACGDTMYNFIPKDEVYTYSVDFKEEVIPDYHVLLRDLVRYGGLSCDTTYAQETYRLVVSDSTTLNNTICQQTIQPIGNSPRYDEKGNWKYVDHTETLDGSQPQMLASLVSALRYYWHIPVFVDSHLNNRIYLDVDPSDFADPDLSFDAVNALLQTKFGLTMVPADTPMPIFTFSVK